MSSPPPFAAEASCACEPRNAALCCDATACGRGGDEALNGNKLVEVAANAPPAAPRLLVRVSHVAGRLPELCCGGPVPSCYSALLSLVCIVPFIGPFLFLLSACLPVETVVELRERQADGQAEGLVTRRSGCCTWRTPVCGVRGVASEEVCDDEAPAKMFLNHASGARKEELSDGFVAGLEAAVNGWLRPSGAQGAAGFAPLSGQRDEGVVQPAANQTSNKLSPQ